MSLNRDTSVRYPARKRAPYGAVAFVVGYLAFLPLGFIRYDALIETSELSIGHASVDLVTVLAPDQVSPLVASGHLFYNAQIVPLSVPVSAGGEFSTAVTVNPLFEAGGVYLLAVLVPAVIYAVAGVLATRDIDTTFPSRRAKKAGLIFTGTAPLAVAMLLPLRVAVPAGNAMPDVLWGTFAAGVIYPVVCAMIGGGLAVVLDD